MTAFRIVDSSNLYVRHILRDIERFQPIGQNILNRTNIIQVRNHGLNVGKKNSSTVHPLHLIND